MPSPRSFPRPARFVRNLGIASAVLLLGSLPFRIWPVDETIQSWAWSGKDGWSFGEHAFWRALYDLGTIPGVVVALVSIVVFALGLVSSHWMPWRKVSAYLLLCMIVGPGLVVNLGFKDHWGRPRPRDTIPFGGRYAMERVGTIDPSSPGKSFPCGHCTMGFYFLAIGMVLRRQGKHHRAVAAFTGALVLGGLLGTARILQGGHFASDVWWGFGFCWLTAIGLFHALRLDEDWVYRPSGATAKPPGPAFAGVLVVGSALFIGFLLSTPYHGEERRREFTVPMAAASVELHLQLEGSHHRITAVPGRTGELRSFGRGHGLPGSKIKERWSQVTAKGTSEITMTQRIRGWFTELDQENTISIPAGIPGTVQIRIASGKAELDRSSAAADQEWIVEVDRNAKATWWSGAAPARPLVPGSTAILKGESRRATE